MDSNTFEVECENCAEDINFGAGHCQYCGMHFDEEFWRDWYDNYWLNLSDDSQEVWGVDDDEPWNKKTEFSKNDNVCCDLPWDRCTCEHPIIWGEHQELISSTEIENAYRFTSDCSECVHFYAPTCQPYRSWLRAYYAKQDFPGEIDDICGDFRSALTEEEQLYSDTVVFMSDRLE